MRAFCAVLVRTLRVQRSARLFTSRTPNRAAVVPATPFLRRDGSALRQTRLYDLTCGYRFRGFLFGSCAPGARMQFTAPPIIAPQLLQGKDNISFGVSSLVSTERGMQHSLYRLFRAHICPNRR